MTYSTRTELTNTAKPENHHGFAIWITGLPASGKSTVTAALADLLRSRGLEVAVLESDVLRRVFTAKPSYEENERESFYSSVACIGEILTQHGVTVIFDATANRREYRERARSRIAKYLEVHVDCPLEVCVDRDPKGIYRRALGGQADTVPGLGTAYEAPTNPDVVVYGDIEVPARAAERILAKIIEKGYLED